MAEKTEPYGDVLYADPGYRDNKKRYPINTPEHVRAAWSYINVAKNAALYTAKQLEMIKERIRKAAKEHGIEVADESGEMALDVLDDRTALLAGVAPLAPPAAWFQDPHLKAPTRLTITDDGRVFGHLAQWRVCHVGIGNRCVMAPKTRTNYGLFRAGQIRTDDGSLVPIGKITLGTGHANDRWGIMPSREHYDNTGWAAALVNIGEDRHGIWVSGALTTTMTPERVVELQAAALSGDWREVNGNLELIAALAVNNPGFPVYREQGGHVFSLMAVGIVGEETMENDTNTEFSEESEEFDVDAVGAADDDAEDTVDDAELAARIERWQQIEDDLEQHNQSRRAAQLAAIDEERQALGSEGRPVPAGAHAPTDLDDEIFVQYNARFQAMQE